MAADRIDRASIFMGASWTGLGGLALAAAGRAPDAPSLLVTTGVLLLIVSSFALLFTRRADEYTAGLWNAGASVAFATLLILTIGLGFVEGLIDGLTDSERDRSISADAALTLAIASFYIGLFVKRLRGDM